MKLSQEIGTTPKRGAFTTFVAECEEPGCKWRGESLAETVSAKVAKKHVDAHSEGML